MERSRLMSKTSAPPPGRSTPRVEESPVTFPTETLRCAKLPSVGLSRRPAGSLVLSFDVEEHDRIEAATGLAVAPELKAHYRERLDVSTRWLLDVLAEAGQQATFFLVGEIARHNPGLIRDVHRAGHEVASHGWDHRRVHHFTPASFREDVRKSREALEDVTGEGVVGYRAPTFSVMRETAWALDVLAEM